MKMMTIWAIEIEEDKEKIMTSILDIQKLDGEKRKAQASIDNSQENKLLQKFTNVMKEGRTFVNNISNASGEMIAEYNELNKRYETLVGKIEIITKQKLEKSNLEHVTEMVNNSNALASECAMIEQRMKELTDKSAKLLSDYNVAMNQLKNTKQKVDALKEMIVKMQNQIKPTVDAIDKKIKELEPTVDKEILAKYKKMREDNVFPVFVKLNGNRCGGCQMSLPLGFIEKLKEKGTLPCEECHRIIIFEDK